ncbi:peptidoglycan-binding protein [Phormidium tenue FACHB-886]|nr:peptidoglycan-binding protein [Phormidium tenue FACHB-886]
MSHSVNPTPLLHPWDVGQAVAELQELLCAHGFSRVRVDGDFGSKTETAVKLFQKQHGLRIDGIVGVETWVALRATVQPGTRNLRFGRSGADVMELQGLLQINGFDVKRDGYFGSKTRAAVISFQQRHQLQPDGLVSSVIWTLLRGHRSPYAPPLRPKPTKKKFS